MATLGAVQLDIVINERSITVTRDHAVSLKVTRLIGDSADQFTLEAYDETAYQLESALMGKKLASISVRYSVSNKDNKSSILFSGTCFNYELSFVGSATMLSITGILASSMGIENGYWFDTRAVEWVGGINYYTDDGGNKVIWGIDGKSQDQYASWKTNEDVCAFLEYPVTTNEDGEKVTSSTPVAYYNPSRIFKRIIHAYNGDKLGSTTTTTTKSRSNSNIVSSGIITDSTAKRVWNYLTNTNGYNKWVAAGIMGNMMKESSMNPAADNGKHYGLCQWSKSGFPQMNGASLNTQLAFIDTWIRRDYNTYKSNYKGVRPTLNLNGFLNLKDAGKAALAFEAVLERSGDSYSELIKRSTYALAYLNYYGGGVTTTITTNEESSTIEGWGTGGSNGFILGKVEESRWIANLPVLQQPNETAAQYITNVLCKYAVTSTEGKNYNEETAGFQYVIKDGKHCFIPLDYGKEVSKANTVEVTYGMQNSEVISFTISKVGVLAMMGPNATKDQIADATSTDYLYGDEIREGGENIFGVEVSSESLKENSEYLNWYDGVSKKSFKGVKISSSTSSDGLSASLSSYWNTLEDYSFSAELTVWADGSNKYVPGKYLDVLVTGAKGIKHYASGIYYITKVEDSISVDGYTQTLKLLKYPKNKANYKSENTGEYVYSDNPTIHDSSGNVISSAGVKVDNSTTAYNGGRRFFWWCRC